MRLGIRSDDQIRHDITEALQNHRRIDASGIDVAVVSGITTIRGTVPTLWQKYAAGEVTDRIKGVTGIANELEVLTISGDDFDEELRRSVMDALSEDVWLDESRITVSADEATIHLLGVVDAYTERSYAEEDAWSVPGVAEVVNELLVAPREGRSEEAIAERIRSAIAENLKIDPSSVLIRVEGDKVFLTGKVHTLAQKWLIDDLAWWTPGVEEVENEMHVLYVPA